MEQERPDLLKQRRDWCDSRGNHAADRLVFLDETGFSTKMSRLRGRSACGERCRVAIPHGHWKTTTFIGALGLSGMTAPKVLDGAMNTNACRAAGQQILVPTLTAGDSVVMDNLSNYKWERRLKQRVASSFTFLPIALILIPSKTALPRSKHVYVPKQSTPYKHCGIRSQTLLAFKPDKCANYFTACGYDLA